MLESKRRTIFKTLTDKVAEISLSSLIMFILGLPLPIVIGLPILIEITQILVYILNERIWSKSEYGLIHEGHLCEVCPIKKCPCPLGKHEYRNLNKEGKL